MSFPNKSIANSPLGPPGVNVVVHVTGVDNFARAKFYKKQNMAEVHAQNSNHLSNGGGVS